MRQDVGEVGLGVDVVSLAHRNERVEDHEASPGLLIVSVPELPHETAVAVAAKGARPPPTVPAHVAFAVRLSFHGTRDASSRSRQQPNWRGSS
jgi:hypothetical protein